LGDNETLATQNAGCGNERKEAGGVAVLDQIADEIGRKPRQSHQGKHGNNEINMPTPTAGMPRRLRPIDKTPVAITMAK
jgi:hypothetical protein